MRDLEAILAIATLVLACLGIGSLSDRFFPSSFSKFDRFTLIFIGGAGLLGTLLFDIGYWAYTRASILTLLIACILIGHRWLWDLPGALRDIGGRHFIRSVPGTILTGILALTAIGGLANPTGGTENDSVAYHFLGPRVWLREGKIRPVLDQSLA